MSQFRSSSYTPWSVSDCDIGSKTPRVKKISYITLLAFRIIPIFQNAWHRFPTLSVALKSIWPEVILPAHALKNEEKPAGCRLQNKWTLIEFGLWNLNKREHHLIPFLLWIFLRFYFKPLSRDFPVSVSMTLHTGKCKRRKWLSK